MQEGSPFSTSSPAFKVYRFFWWWPFHLVWGNHTVVLICIWVMLSIFSCVYWPYLCLIWRAIFLQLKTRFKKKELHGILTHPGNHLHLFSMAMDLKTIAGITSTGIIPVLIIQGKLYRDTERPKWVIFSKKKKCDCWFWLILWVSEGLYLSQDLSLLCLTKLFNGQSSYQGGGDICQKYLKGNVFLW